MSGLTTAALVSLLGACDPAQKGDAAIVEIDSSTYYLTALHPLGAIPDSPAQLASKMLSTPRLANAAVLPASVDLTSRTAPPGNQQAQGSCVAWAVGYATKTLQEVTENQWAPSSSNHQFSPSWIYNQINSGVDKGSYVSDALNLLVNRGADTLQDFPYNANDFVTQPTTDSIRRASYFKAKSWNTLSVSTENIKNILAGGNAVIVAFNVLPDYDALNSSTNTVYDTAAGTRPPSCMVAPCSRGGHANAIIGYDDSRQAFKLINSWGTGWGSGGYGWLAYSFITDPSLGLAAYVLVDKPNGPNVPTLPEIHWHNSSGSTQVWYMNGALRSGLSNFDSSLTVADNTGWTAVGISDFDEDGLSDVLWHNGTTGATQIWYMNGSARAAYSTLDSSLNVADSTGWRIVGTNDFNQDGHPDILWHNGASGATQVWYMNLAARIGYADFDPSLNVADNTGWRVVGTNDFNRDGHADILWHNGTSGATQVWYMNGVLQIGAENFDASLTVADSTGWRVAETNDFDRDGHPDILWHNGTSGASQIWLMNGVWRSSFLNLDSSLTITDGTGWSIINR